MAIAWLMGLFFVSGFCSLIYEVAWLRLAMGAFGVSAPYVSLFLSAFMGALGLGSWLGGRLVQRSDSRTAAGMLRLYAAAESILAASALAVPSLLAAGKALLSGPLGTLGWGSAGYYAISGLLTAAILLPWCLCMGMTFPLAMSALRKAAPARGESSFSSLYLANVLGASVGAAAAAFVLIELLGLRGTLLAAASLNAAAAATAFLLAAVVSPSEAASAPSPVSTPSPALAGAGALPLLFVTGLASMGMEVVWVRQFTPYLGTTIYAFAAILIVYLAATFLGSWLFRLSLRGRWEGWSVLAWTTAGALSLLPLSSCEPDLPLWGWQRLAGIVPFCTLLGFLTPSLVDLWSAGDPGRAGSAYAVNVLGCVLGPLLAGFCLLPRLPERYALGLLALPLFAAGLASARRHGQRSFLGRLKAPAFFVLVSVPTLLLPFLSSSHDEVLAQRAEGGVILRDYQAVVVAGGEGRRRFLSVNGVSMTALTPATKVMAHLPLAALPHPPRNALVICFGMGTTFRSLASWAIPVTAVELVPSVPRLFSRFHSDAGRVLAAPGARVVIDDGRRFLARSRERYDVITIDAAPPMEAAGTSFLFSREFYAAARARLEPDGILQQWIFNPKDPAIVSAFASALKESFPYVRVFHAFERYGDHVLASNRPIPLFSAAELAARLPPAARRDLLEWGPGRTAAGQFKSLLNGERSIDSLIMPAAGPLRDDRPTNEYYFLRRNF